MERGFSPHSRAKLTGGGTASGCGSVSSRQIDEYQFYPKAPGAFGANPKISQARADVIPEDVATRIQLGET